MKRVDLIVPCYNESESLLMFYDKTCEVIDPLPYEFNFIFIDDGSRDNTIELIIDLANKDERIKYISFSRNFGKEAGIYAGLKNSTGDFVCVIDADLQHPPEYIPAMLKACDDEGYDTCACRRVSRDGEPKIRSFFARQFYKLINKMSDVEIVDGSVDFRMMRRMMVNAVLDMPEVERFSKGIFAWVGFKTKWLEFKNVERIAGETKWSFWSLFKYAISGITAFTTVPLRLATIFGVVISSASFIYLAIELLKTLILGIDVPGYASTITLILFIGGLMMLFFGIIGEYLSKLYTEIKRRPIYISRLTNIEDKKNEK